jgi:hypothetical protein
MAAAPDSSGPIITAARERAAAAPTGSRSGPAGMMRPFPKP